jgi:hypothetical protein
VSFQNVSADSMQSKTQVQTPQLAAHKQRSRKLLTGTQRIENNAAPTMAKVNNLPSAAHKKFG